MAATIDFAALAAELREVPETLVDQKERENISPYMFEVILPMLARGEYPCCGTSTMSSSASAIPPDWRGIWRIADAG